MLPVTGNKPYMPIEMDQTAMGKEDKMKEENKHEEKKDKGEIRVGGDGATYQLIKGKWQQIAPPPKKQYD
ncbi:hypothetical protein IFR08_00810 [Pseudomonas fluorescens]|uniref:hypothetical protein n=1 Tax=Pseudomonas TaxID=286 RepID=UPI000812506F|nr:MULTISPECIES: hypothetical protein [Pseudomonas]MBD8096193.1 hypothetical protein [Pseudomonas fluorescens]MBD8772316.1 hypothetical protein [Pseudomonas fluorescens]MBD8778838.1 hypothetical protein [Pseudomonas fluorescens]MBD8794889.1 hypothetical protein [Pseudomonas fluorescens]TKK34830.1 hypothetical protein PspCFBP13528_04270 [Pseudomonas sp. CFBP13528]